MALSFANCYPSTASVTELNASVSNTPHGLFIASLLSPRFPVNRAIAALSESDNPAFSFVDYSFGSQYENLQALVDGLLGDASPAHSITVIVYAECGPCRPPRRPRGYFPLTPTGLSITQLNKRLGLADVRVVETIADRLAFIHSQLSSDPRIKYIIHRGLEDNFDKPARTVYDALLEQEFTGNPQVSIGENPLNQRQRRVKSIKEFHQNHLKGVRRGDIVNLDGTTGFCFRNESGCHGLSYAATQRLLRDAKRKGIILLLWRAEWQGATVIPVPERKRKYRITNVSELKRLLRR
jgi:hypothetical protein